MEPDLALDRSMTFDYGIPQEVAPRVRRIVARNPGPMTFKGTNTYLLGHHGIAVIDPGPDDPAHRAAILEAAGRSNISHIVVTHGHLDHSAGVRTLQSVTGARVCAYPRPPLPGDELAAHGHSDVALADASIINGKDWALQAIHTPGHAPDHLCFALAGSPVLFSGDHVMGWNTTIIAPPEGRMSAYLASLEKLLAAPAGTCDLYLPGHGAVVPGPRRFVRSLLLHRRMRSSMISACLADGLDQVDAITLRLYRGLDPGLINAAKLSVLAHLVHLMEQAIAVCDGAPGLQARFRLRA